MFNLKSILQITVNRVLSISIIMVIVGAIIMFGYVITHPIEETFTEFYVLDPNGMAEAYPKELTVGEEGKVLLGITNQEQKTMIYEVKTTVEGIPEETIGPLELEHNENWEKEMNFTPHELCAHTKLAETVDPGTGTYVKAITSIEVESIEHLKPGDYIWISGEFVQIYSIMDNTVSLSRNLNGRHEKGSEVRELQKVEFKLYKLHQLQKNDEKQTLLSLWLGKETLDARLINQAAYQSTYELVIKVMATLRNDGTQRTKTETIGPITLAPQQAWCQEIDYAYPGARTQDVEFSLFKDGKRVYREKTDVNYPALHLWIEVAESNL